MKKLLVLSLLLLSFSAVAFAGPSLNPWVEVNVPPILLGVVLAPTLDAGLTIEGMLSPAWFIDLGFTYNDFNLLSDINDISLGFESNIGFDELATVNTTGSLIYGCELTFACDITYNVNYPDDLLMVALVPQLKASGYVGPLELWAGINLPWTSTNVVPRSDNWGIEPFFGVRVDFDINL